MTAASANTEQIRAHHRSIRRLGAWTTARRFDIRASGGGVVLDLLLPELEPGEITVELDIDHSTVILLVPDGTNLDDGELRRVGRGRVKDWTGEGSPNGRSIRLTGEMRNAEVRIHRGGIAILRLLLSRGSRGDVRRAHAAHLNAMTLARRPIRFRHLERGDFALLADWFARDHVAPWWQEPADLPLIENRYGPAIDGQDATEVYIVELDRTPIGLIQRYLVDDDPAWRSTLAPANPPAPAAGIDYLIGEQTHTGHGLGPLIIDRFLTDTWRRYPTVVAVLVAVQQANRRSWRALEKSGFHRAWAGTLASDDPSDRGPSYLYERARPQPPAIAASERDGTTLSAMETPGSDAGARASDEKAAPPSALGLIILWQLVAGPNHAYGLQKLFTSQGKDRVVNLHSRANLQQAIKRLQRLGLVDVHETVRGEGYPDRIVYAITDSGREAARVWLREMLAETAREYPDFVAAVSILFGLEPDDARVQLERRAAQLADALADTDAQLQGSPDLPRLFLLEEEYRKTILAAQLSWVHAVIDDLRSGRLTWNEQWLAELFAAYHPEARENGPGD